MITEYGNTIAKQTWNLMEPRETGYCRVYYVHEADIRYKDSSIEIALQPDHLYVLPSALPYRAWRVSSLPFRCMFLHCVINPKSTTALVDIAVKENTALYHILHAIMAAIDEQNESLVEHLGRVLMALLETQSAFRAPSPKICGLLDYITDNVGGDLSIETLSSMLHFSPHYFIRLFRQEVGCSPHQYIRAVRLRMAEQLLTEELPVGEVAKLVGYSDESTFSRAYKDYWGTRPSGHKRAALIP